MKLRIVKELPDRDGKDRYYLQEKVPLLPIWLDAAPFSFATLEEASVYAEKYKKGVEVVG